MSSYIDKHETTHLWADMLYTHKPLDWCSQLDGSVDLDEQRQLDLPSMINNAHGGWGIYVMIEICRVQSDGSNMHIHIYVRLYNQQAISSFRLRKMMAI